MQNRKIDRKSKSKRRGTNTREEIKKIKRIRKKRNKKKAKAQPLSSKRINKRLQNKKRK